MSLTVAFLGLGHMGGPMSKNLVAAGHTVRGFDPVPAAAAAAADNGVVVLDSGPAAVAGADVVITMLPHGDAVKRCYAEILPAANQGALFIDSSTISVDDAREVHASAASHGLAQLDAPVSGGVKGAVAGTLAFMVGGDVDALQPRTSGAGTDGGQDHSLRRGRRRPGRQGLQQHGARRAADRDRRGVRAGRKARAFGAVAVRRHHRRDRKLLGSAYQLPGARPGADLAGQQ